MRFCDAAGDEAGLYDERGGPRHTRTALREVPMHALAATYVHVIQPRSIYIYGHVHANVYVLVYEHVHVHVYVHLRE